METITLTIPWEAVQQQRHCHFQAYPYEPELCNKDFCSHRDLGKQSHDVA